jgi:hypothetical protein
MFHTWFFDLEFFAMEETYNIISKRKKLCYMCEVQFVLCVIDKQFELQTWVQIQPRISSSATFLWTCTGECTTFVFG